MQARLSIAVGIALVWAVTGPARADDRGDTGYIGGATRTDEVDSCKRDATTDVGARRANASEHYSRGNTLYIQGDYEGAIEEFVAAYCDAPHYEMLKNIAQSYERLLEFEKAVAYLSRYILEIPKGDRDDALELEIEKTSYRVQVLSNLPARVQVATVPPGAQVTLTGETGINAQATAGDKIKVRKGTYELKIEHEGFEPIVETIEVEIGQPYSYYFRLEPKKGTLRVITDPPNARIFIDRRLVGIGNYVERLAIGEHEVTVESDNREPATRKVEITDGRTANLTIKLDKEPASGRRQLLVASTLGGGLFGSATFATVFGEGGFEASLGGLLGLGIGFGGGYFGVPRDISVGRSSYVIGTTVMGAVEGAALAHWIFCDTSVSLEDDENSRCGEIVGGATIASGVGGLLFGAITADTFDLDAGDAALVNSGGQWGTVGGLLFVAAFGNERRLLSPLTLAGLNLGAVAGGLIARRFDMSRGHVALIDLAGLAGMIAGVATVDVIQPGERSERVPHFALLGMTAGLITGAYLTRNMDEPASPAVRSLSASVGGAVDAEGSPTLTWGLAGAF